MSTRAVIVTLAVATFGGLLAGLLYARLGDWVFLAAFPLGWVLAIALEDWDTRSGKQGWFS